MPSSLYSVVVDSLASILEGRVVTVLQDVTRSGQENPFTDAASGFCQKQHILASCTCTHVGYLGWLVLKERMIRIRIIFVLHCWF